MEGALPATVAAQSATVAAQSATVAAQSQLLQFKVHKKLGQGSYGKVYKVERICDGQIYAIKETDLGKLSQQDRMDAVNEVRLLVSICHANVIRYNETFISGQRLYTVMEYSPHGDLSYYIAKGRKLNSPFPEEVVWRILLQLCYGLKALHAARIIHRDLKPANIFLGQKDVVKIGDLGVAKALKQIQFTYTTIGTPCYMAPEVWSGRGYSFSSDLWSLGAVLYEMMTFRTPFTGNTVQELCTKIVGGRFSPIPTSQYSPDLVNICHTLLHPDPVKRPSLNKILSGNGAMRWQHVLAGPMTASQPLKATASVLLDTIQVPKDIRMLQKNLPPPSY